MKNAKTDSKLRSAGGKFLRARRLRLDLTMAEIAFRAGVLSLNQIAIHKIEIGVKGIRLSDILNLSRAYAVEAKELLKFTKYSEAEFADYLKSMPSESLMSDKFDVGKSVTIEDLKFLLTVAEGLQRPLNLGQVVQLLGQRQ